MNNALILFSILLAQNTFPKIEKKNKNMIQSQTLKYNTSDINIFMIYIFWSKIYLLKVMFYSY